MFSSSAKGEIRHFHVAVVKLRQRNVQKSVMHVQSCCFANLNLLLFCRKRCPCRRRCLGCLFMNVINNHFCIINHIFVVLSSLPASRITAKGLTLSRPSSQKGRYKMLKMFHVAGTKPPKTVRQVVLVINCTCFVYHRYSL